MQNYIYEVTLTGDRDLVVEVSKTGIVSVRLGKDRKSFALPAFARVVRLNPDAVEVAYGERDGVEGMYLTLPDGTVWWVDSEKLVITKVADTVQPAPAPQPEPAAAGEPTVSEEPAAVETVEAMAAVAPEIRPVDNNGTAAVAEQQKQSKGRYQRVKEILAHILKDKVSEEDLRQILHALDTYRVPRVKEPDDPVTKVLKKMARSSIISGELRVENHTVKFTRESVELYVDGQLVRRVPRPHTF